MQALPALAGAEWSRTSEGTCRCSDKFCNTSVTEVTRVNNDGAALPFVREHTGRSAETRENATVSPADTA